MNTEFKRLKKGERGFTLIGVIMAGSLLGFLTLATLTLADIMTKMASKSKFDHEVITDLTLLRLSFANASACGANLAGTVVSPTYTELPVDKKSFKFPKEQDSSELGTQSILSDNSHLQAISLRLEAPGSNLARLKLDFKNLNQTIGGSEVSRDLIISVSLDSSNQIVSCSTDTSVGNTPDARPSDESEDESLHIANQGQGCNGSPTGEDTNFNGAFASPEQKQAAINKLCSAQTYPLKGSVDFPSDCSFTPLEARTNSPECKTLIRLAQSETVEAFRSLRQNYESENECQKQFASSEGASARKIAGRGTGNYLCFNGRWVRTGSSGGA